VAQRLLVLAVKQRIKTGGERRCECLLLVLAFGSEALLVQIDPVEEALLALSQRSPYRLLRLE